MWQGDISQPSPLGLHACLMGIPTYNEISFVQYPVPYRPSSILNIRYIQISSHLAQHRKTARKTSWFRCQERLTSGLAGYVHDFLHLCRDVFLWFLHKLRRFCERRRKGRVRTRTGKILQHCWPGQWTMNVDFLSIVVLNPGVLPSTCRYAPALTEGTLLLRRTASHS